LAAKNASRGAVENPLAFTGNPLDRARASGASPPPREKGLFLPFWQMKPLLRADRAAFLPWQADWEGRTTVLLGLEGTQALFGIDLGGDEPAPVFDGGEFHDMRAAAFVLPARDTAIAGQAKALLDWHARHGFCPRCGHATLLADSGYRRDCPHCGAEHFPRTDPVVIMLPLFEDMCLVGRNARFAGGLFSAFAGFVEPGETMEEAVRRELREETALTVGAVRYHRSQPWPFPSSLMLGCYAEALSRDFVIDGVEIAEARWVSRKQARQWVQDEMLDEMRLPAVIAIAHHLVKDWACD
jgi:NAD+ diphosphatase